MLKEVFLIVLLTYLLQTSVSCQGNGSSTSSKMYETTNPNEVSDTIQTTSNAILSDDQSANQTREYQTKVNNISEQPTSRLDSSTDIYVTEKTIGSTSEVVDGKTYTTTTKTPTTTAFTTTESDNDTTASENHTSTTSADDTDALTSQIQMMNTFTKAVIVIVCVCYFGAFLLCSIRVCVRRIKEKAPYAVYYSHLKNDRDDSGILMENME